ncbi:alpha/beta hydrolase [Winogradskyella sp. DF17]|uniref:Alpha/beta hydrolase n=1 Tax=Winogradskyella pelagia TaxID=2819984 RepID=A0ABS3SX95_9FLAO|nr:alpha/beta hydrolase [Winogradskyella sp. DF17]MBO3115115.1 alpha/beta hydrolase [Winogradskyella sp. DF17]
MKQFILCIALITIAASIQAQNNQRVIEVKVSGQGEPLLFIPGFTVPGDIWEPFVKQLEQDFECHVITLAGFGGKTPIDFPWLPQVNSALQNYIIANNLSNVTIIGHSLGGTIATWLASRDSLNLRQIILVDALPASGALMIPNFNPDNLVYESPFNSQQLNMTDEEFAQMAAGMSRGMSLNTSSQEQIKKWMVNADRKTYVYGYTDYLKLDLRKDLKSINIPVTIIAADTPYGKDMVTKTYQSQYANLKTYDFILAENAAHFIMLD